MPQPQKNSSTPKRTSGAGNKPKIAVAILAAGKGTRMNSRHPKVLHQVGGKPLLAHVVDAAKRVCPAEHVYAIIGHDADRVREAMNNSGIGFILQKEQRGTGHALMVGRDVLSDYEYVLVLSGDAPLIRTETIERLRDFHLEQGAAMTLLSAVLDRPRGYGRVIFKPDEKQVEAIVEEKALNPALRELKEVN